MHAAVASQYGAALAMLRRTIEQCPDDLWFDDSAYRNATWHIAYHTLYYTHLYVMLTEHDFVAWANHREGYQFLGATPWPPHEPTQIEETYTKAQLLSYHDHVVATVDQIVPTLDLAAEESGFHWISLDKLGLQIYNIRHVQQHTGELCERIYVAAEKEVDWVGKVTSESPA